MSLSRRGSLNKACPGSNENITELKTQLKDALEKNSRWQAYNCQREEYVKNLLAKYNQTRTELQSTRNKLEKITSNPDQLAAEQRRYFDKLLVEARLELQNQRNETLHANTQLSIIKEKYENDIRNLENAIENWRHKYGKICVRLATLNAKNDESNHKSNTQQRISGNRNLKVQFYEDDELKKVVVENELNIIKEKVEELQRKVDHRDTKAFRRSFDNLRREEVQSSKLRVHTVNKNQTSDKATKNSQALFQNCVSDTIPEHNSSKPKSAESKVDLTLGRSDLKTRRSKPRKYRSLPASTYSEAANEDLLYCPSCGKRYPISEHASLLDHIDICGD